MLTGEITSISGATKNSQLDWHFNGRKSHTNPYGSLKQKPLGFMTNISVSPLNKKKQQLIVGIYSQVSGVIVLGKTI